MTYQISTFPCGQDGFMRWAQMDAPKPSKGCVLIGLGWSEWLEKYAPIAEEWATRGFDCVVLEWRGQALSSRFLDDRNKGHHTSFEPLLDDIDAFVAWYFENDPGPVFLMGHSMGAHLLLRWYAERNAPLNIIRGLILLSLKQQVITAPYEYWVAELIAWSGSTFGLSKHYAPGQAKYDPLALPFLGNHLTRDEVRYNAMLLALRENTMLKTGGLTFGWLHASFQSARKLWARLKHGMPRGPYLMLCPENDPLVSTEAMKRVAAYLPNCTAHFFPDTGHELLQERDEVRVKLREMMDVFVAKNI